LIAEKIATALDHAYNTTVEGERTLHGLVWPGFVSLSDDGETGLTGFGLAQGLLPSRGRARFGKEVAPYLAPEERSEGTIGKNSDVYSVGVLLFELLTGRLPAPAGPVADLFAVARGPSPLPPDHRRPEDASEAASRAVEWRAAARLGKFCSVPIHPRPSTSPIF
jgi:serine/threonine-protein kinase